MVETLTPAGCGSRQRYRVALAVVGALALAAAAREAGLVRIPVPELRRQVPERWRREWPLAGWSAGYGAGLGVGVLTHQTVWTFWVAMAGALALGDPLVSALCLAPFGLARGLMVALPARGGRDPAASGRVLAVAATDAAGESIVVRPAESPEVRYVGGRSPALDGDLLAYADGAGIRILRWRTGEEIGRIDGALAKPALVYPLVAYVRAVPDGRRLKLRNMATGALRWSPGAAAGSTSGARRCGAA